MAQLKTTTIYGDLTVTGSTNLEYDITSTGDFTATGDLYGASLYIEEDANSSYYLRLYNNSGLTANKTLTFNTNNADRTISLSGNLTLANSLTTSGNYALTLTTTATTSITLPTTGTVATLAGTEAFTNKTYNGYTLAAACDKAVTDSSSASAIGTGTSLPTERDIYYGLPTINNAHNYTSSTTLYAPSAGGAAGTILVGAGTTTAPTWTTVTIPSTVATGAILITSTANALTALASTTGLTNLQNNAGTITWAATTGTGNVVYSTSPSLTTPSLGVATATSINKVTITAPTTSATLTIANGKTLTASNTITFTATDGSTLAIGGGGTLGSAAYTASTAYAPAAGSSSIVTVGTITSGTWSGSTIAVNKGGTGATTFTANAILTGNGTSAIQAPGPTLSSTAMTFGGAGTINSTSTNALTLDSGTTGGVNLGTNANAKTVTIGNATGATGVVVNSGTGGVTFNQVASGIFKIQASAVPTTDMVQITNSGYANATAGVNALNVTYVGGAAAVESSAIRTEMTPGGTSGGTWSSIRVINGASVTGVVTNGVKFDTKTAGTGTANVLWVGTGWDNILNYNGTTVVNGTGNVIAGQLSGTIPSAVLGNSTIYIGTTGIALNRGTGAQSLTGITSIDGSASKLTTARTIAISTGATGTATSFDGSANITIPVTSLAAAYLSGTIPSAVLGNSTHYIGTTAIALNRGSGAQSLTGITSIDGSAAKLTTARAIAGVSFDGSANISIPFANLSSIPTTLSGYGITDAATSTHTHTFASLTSKPTTLSGYGITDFVGFVAPFAGTSAPAGWLACNGQAVSRTTYSSLFAAIGTTWGVGDGTTTFNLPDLRETTLVGTGTRGSGVVEHDTYTVGQFKDDQIQNHKHNAYAVNNYISNSNSGGSGHPLVTGLSDITAPVEISGYGIPRVGTTTHGKQTGILWCIKY